MIQPRFDPLIRGSRPKPRNGYIPARSGGRDLSRKLCILDREGNKRLHRNARAKPHEFLRAVEPFREDLIVGVECMFTWYWLADLCLDENISFVLGHALYMKAIHGGKKKDDKIDSEKIAPSLLAGSRYGRTLTRTGAWINVDSRVHGGRVKKASK